MDRTYVVVTDSGENSSLCRLCAKYHENYVNIFISNGAFKSTVEKAILDLINIKVVQGDGLPCVACIECVGKLMELRDFKVMCLMSDIKLKKSAVGSHVTCNVKEEKLDIEATREDSSDTTTLSGQDASNFDNTNAVTVECNMKEEESYIGTTVECWSDTMAISFQNATNIGSPNAMTVESCVKEEVDWKDAPEEHFISVEDMGKNTYISVDQLPEIEERVDIKIDIPRDPLGESEYCSDTNIGDGATTKDATVYCECSLEGQEIKSKHGRNKNPCTVHSSPGYGNVELATVAHDAVDGNLFDVSDKEMSPKSVKNQIPLKFPRIVRKRKDDVTESSEFSRESDEDESQKSTGKHDNEEHSLRKSFDDVGLDTRNVKELDHNRRESYEHPDGMIPHEGHSEIFDEKDVVYQFETLVKCYSCSTCLKSFACKRSLQSHISIHFEEKQEKTHVCKVCLKSFFKSYHLRDHMRGHTGVKHYECDVCAKCFSWKSKLRTHMRVHTGERPFQCNECSRSFCQSGSLRTHMRIHVVGKSYVCSLCSKSFSEIGGLRRHTRTHTGERPFECHVCGKSFSESGSLRRHTRIHTGERSYRCDVCGKSFTESGSLRNHMRIHTGERPYQCEMCSMAFMRSSALRLHMKFHLGEKPFKCSECRMAFTTNSDLRRHTRVHTGVKPYECDVCCRSFAHSASLKMHKRVHSDANQYK